jgi:magnesium-transporting ATPase (P-type)
VVRDGALVTESENGEKRKTYLEERKLLVDAERESARSFDKSMLTLSSGALALSITFIRQIAPAPRFETYLYLAWSGFILALLCTLVSFLSSQTALRKQRDILDLNYQDSRSASEQKNLMSAVTNYLNWFSILSFIIGVLCLTVFAIKNLSIQEEMMSEKTPSAAQQSSEVEKRGFVPPKPPVEQPSDKPQTLPQGTSKPDKK